jgi:hypothetical protein
VLQGSVNRQLGEFNVAGGNYFEFKLRFSVAARQEWNFALAKHA